MSDLVAATLTRRIILGLLLGGLVVLSYAVLHLFRVPVAWAVILAYATWPLYARLRLLLRGNATGSALIMTLLLTAAFVLPVLWLVVLLRGEIDPAHGAYRYRCRCIPYRAASRYSSPVLSFARCMHHVAE